MNKFNSVFRSIKKNCGAQGEMKREDCFEIIAAEAGIQPEKVEFFLSTLQDLQLIKYSVKEQYIKLTSFGKRQDRLFTDS